MTALAGVVSDVGSAIELSEPWTFVPADVRRPPLRLGLLGFAHMFAWNAVPGVPWRLQPNLPPQCLAGAHLTRVVVPDAWSGARILLAIPGVAHHATVFVDGTEIGATTSPWTPQEFDLTPHVMPGGEHELRIDVVDRTLGRTEEGWATPPGLTVDLLLPEPPDRGLVFGAPRLEPRPLLDVDVKLVPDFESRTTRAILAVTNHDVDAFRGPIGIEVARWGVPGAAHDLGGQVVVIDAGASTQLSFLLAWPIDPDEWWWPNTTGNADHRASLHVLTPVVAGERRRPVRFGFCDIRQEGSRYLVNGVVLNLRGDNPTIDGEATSVERCRALVEGALRTGLNVIRPHAQPAPEHLYEIADEHGLLLVPETGIYASLGVLDARDPEPFAEHVRQLVRRDRNHPCVAKYSVMNEGHEAGLARDFVLTLVEAAKATDPTRPVSVDESGGCDYGAPIVDIQHYSETDPSAPEGHPRRYLAPRRDDRPYGQGEFLFGVDGDDHPLGLVRQGLHIRARRLNGEADIRPHTVHKHLAYDAVPPVDDGRVSLGAKAGTAGAASLGHFRRSVAAVAAWDLGFDDVNALPGPHGALRAATISEPGDLVRRVAVVNDDLRGGDELVLHWSVVGHSGSTPMHVPVGSHVVAEVALPELEPGTAVLELVVDVDGVVRFHSDEVVLDVEPRSRGPRS